MALAQRFRFAHMHALLPLLVASVPSEHAPVDTQPTSATVPVFYNLYLSSHEDEARVQKLARDQLSWVRSQHKVFVHTIGTPLVVPNTTLIEHHAAAFEEVTLHSLWSHCVQHPDGHAVYLHSKGSYHPSPQNDLFRMFLTRGVLSKDCANLPATCNVCGSRMSPIPHPHMPGNMFLARCSYVAKLIDPLMFADAMAARVLHTSPTKGDSCRGGGRYANEHWILSHPDGAPCDLYENRAFTWDYENIPSGDFDKSLAAAPRFELQAYIHPENVCSTRSGASLEERLDEYRDLYETTPAPSWWGWYFFGLAMPDELGSVRGQRNVFIAMTLIEALAIAVVAGYIYRRRRRMWSHNQRPARMVQITEDLESDSS